MGSGDNQLFFTWKIAIKTEGVCVCVFITAVEDYARDTLTDTLSNMELRPKSE